MNLNLNQRTRRALEELSAHYNLSAAAVAALLIKEHYEEASDNG